MPPISARQRVTCLISKPHGALFSPRVHRVLAADCRIVPLSSGSLHAALPPWLPVMPRKGLSNGSWPASPSRWICLSTSRAAAASVKAREPIEQEPLLRVVLGQPVADHRHRDLVGNQVRPGRGNPGPQAGTADHIRHAGGGEPAMRRAEPHEHRWALAEGRRVRAMTTIPGSCSSSAENSPAAQRHAPGGARFWCATG